MSSIFLHYDLSAYLFTHDVNIYILSIIIYMNY